MSPMPCANCGHPGFHAQITDPGAAGRRPTCDDCQRCQAEKRSPRLGDGGPEPEDVVAYYGGPLDGRIGTQAQVEAQGFGPDGYLGFYDMYSWAGGWFACPTGWISLTHTVRRVHVAPLRTYLTQAEMDKIEAEAHAEMDRDVIAQNGIEVRRGRLTSVVKGCDDPQDEQGTVNTMAVQITANVLIPVVPPPDEP